jgi:predicted GIY-YIG superfamily endonuclease
VARFEPCSVSKTQSTIYPQSTQATKTQARKRCHGNKKLQRFRQRRRARGINEVAINKTIEARKREKQKQEMKKQQKITTLTTTQSRDRKASTTRDTIPVSIVLY